MKITTWLVRAVAVLVAAFGLSFSSPAQPRMEALTRGVVAVHQPDGRVFVSWRLFGNDPADTAFNLYRTTAPRTFGGFGGRRRRNSNEPTIEKLNEDVIMDVTWFLDSSADLGRETSYVVRPVLHGVEGEPSAPFVFAAGAPPLPYRSVPLQTPEGYTPNDAAVADLDGDGDYEIVLHQTGRGNDNARSGFTSEPVFQAYEMDGTLLWTINLGKNVREGAHYTQFLVYDFDGDGRAEFVCKTADGSMDGRGTIIGDPNADWVEPQDSKVPSWRRDGTESEYDVTGRILRGPEYLTVFDGLTGAALSTVSYLPQRDPDSGEHSPSPRRAYEIWGDTYANRSDRFLACVAYLDGEHPSIVMCRGYYTRAVLAAWDWRDGQLKSRWVFDSDDGTPGNEAYRGQGNHNLSVADVDDDGRQEIVYGAAVIDDDGTGLYSTGWGHGDAMHVGDLVPDNPGIEVFNIQERFAGEGMNMRDGATGEPLFLIPSVQAATEGGDAGEGPGRGAAFNIDPRFPGAETWAAGAAMSGVYTARGERFAERPDRGETGLPVNFAVYWDGDLLRELLDRNHVLKWNWETEKVDALFTAQFTSSNNGTKSTPAISADLFGDWREEVMLRTLDGKELRIYTTTIPTKYRMPTLMHDPQYRVAVAWQNTAYNQPPHPSFYLDPAAPLPTWPAIQIAK